MRILHVLPSFGLGGMEKIVCTLINGTSDSYTHEILALNQCTHAGVWIKGKRVKLIEFDKPEKRGSFFCALYRVLRQTRPDLLMTYNWGASDAIWLGRAAGIRRIIHNEHGFNIEETSKTDWRRDLFRFVAFRLAGKLIVVSRELESFLHGRYFLGASQVSRIPNGIDTSYYSPDCDERQQMREMLGFTDREVVVGFSGRLDAVKDLGRLFTVFAHFLRKHSHVRLLIVGDGPERRQLEALCQREKLETYILFAGQQADVLPYLRAMDAFLLTSLREQMPMTLLEAMAVGVPVVATNVGEVPYIIDDGVSGFVLDVDAPSEAFVQALAALIDPALRETIGGAARKKVARLFQEQAMVQKYKAVIQSLS